MAGEKEICSGLMWDKSRSVPWSCQANTHVYNVRRGPAGWAPPHRPGLSWILFKTSAHPSLHVHVQVAEVWADRLTVAFLEIDGEPQDGLERP